MRSILGGLWIVAWCAVLYVLSQPWAELGGIVSELDRWIGRLALWGGAGLGGVVGLEARDAASHAGGPTHRDQWRCLGGPLVVVTLLGVLGFRVFGDWVQVLQVTTAGAALWGGFDITFAGWPLVNGDDWGFDRRIRVADDLGESGGDADLSEAGGFPWERGG